MVKFLNNRGVSIIGSMAAVGISLITIAGLSSVFTNMQNHIYRLESRMLVNVYIQEIQSRSMIPQTCERLIGAGTNIDLAKMAQSHRTANNQTPGSPVTVQLLNGLTFPKPPAAGGAPPTPSVHINQDVQAVHMALTDRRDTGRTGPNGFPLYQANLFGVFVDQRFGLDQLITAKPLASLYVEIDPGSSSLATCFGAAGSGLSNKEIVCRNFGGTWDATKGECTADTVVVVQDGGGPLGTDGSIPPPTDPAPSGLGKSCGSVAAGTIKTGGGIPGSVTITQCINGSWRSL